MKSTIFYSATLFTAPALARATDTTSVFGRGAVIGVPVEEMSPELADRDSGLEKRANPRCDGGSFDWKSAEIDDINTGIKYLRGLTGTPKITSRTCVRVSCSWAASIWWCNDRTDELQLNNWGVLADCAQKIADNCQKPSGINEPNFVIGQHFKDNWNCIVRHDTSNGC